MKPGILEKNVGRDLNWLAELRQAADYGELRSVSLSDAEDAINIADCFLNAVNRLLEQNS